MWRFTGTIGIIAAPSGVLGGFGHVSLSLLRFFFKYKARGRPPLMSCFFVKAAYSVYSVRGYDFDGLRVTVSITISITISISTITI